MARGTLASSFAFRCCPDIVGPLAMPRILVLGLIMGFAQLPVVVSASADCIFSLPLFDSVKVWYAKVGVSVEVHLV